MAMYENEGFCPNNTFTHYALEKGENVSKLWTRVQEILGDRPGYMVYTNSNVCYYDTCYVVDALMGATSTMGIEIATTLKLFIPKCKYAECGKKIVVMDCINPYQIPGLYMNGDEFCCAEDSLELFQDDRYVCGVINGADVVYMYFFKKAEKK